MIRIGKYRIQEKTIYQNFGIWMALIVILSIPFDPGIGFALILPLIIPVYLHLFFLEKYYNRKKYLWYVLLTLATIIFFGVLAEELANSSGLRTRVSYSGGLSESEYYFRTFFINAGYNPFLAIIISTVIRYFRQKQMFQLQQLQEQKIRAELDLLRNQVNPHFLFNTLNTLFSMASVKEDDDTAKGIAQLSELMRYMLYDARVDRVLLEKEINHIRNYIDLQKLRFSDEESLSVEFNIQKNIRSCTVPPMLIIPFIENAFKHGYSVKNENLIRIDLMIYDNYLNFKVYNTIPAKQKKQSVEHSGIGIDNVRKRLELLYGESFTLDINESEGHFDVYLKMPISGSSSGSGSN